LYFR